MKLFIVLRRQGFASPADLDAAAGRSRETGDEMAADVRWIRSYVVDDRDGTLGTVCVYQATSEAALRDHAAKAAIPSDEVLEVTDTVVVRADPPGAAPAAEVVPDPLYYSG